MVSGEYYFVDQVISSAFSDGRIALALMPEMKL